jgi:alcohol dehydrogenase class IV
VCDVLALHAKTGIASRRLRPTRAVVDPDATATLPASVVAASGFDVLCHAIESYTARPYTARLAPAAPALRPMSQGANPWSDLGSAEALRLAGRYFLRAVRDATDHEARGQMMWAATYPVQIIQSPGQVSFIHELAKRHTDLGPQRNTL